MLDDGHWLVGRRRGTPISSMPFSTLSAVRTPGSDSPSSTSVMATAGRMPTTTVRASSTRAMAAMFAEHPADEGVDDLERRDVDQDAAWRGSRRCAP